MAAVHTLQTMTLGQSNKMYNLIQHSPAQNGNCVIVSQQSAKSVIHKRPLAPAPERSTVVVTTTNSSDLRCKRKIQFNPYGAPNQQPASVARRNARERNRVKQVNNGFATLRQHIPSSVSTALSPQGAGSGSGSGSSRGQNKKLSKVETLRLAVEYIRSLQQMIEDYENNTSTGRTCDNQLDQTNIIDNRYYSSSSPESINNQQFTYPVMLPTPTCSEASASPTPSHSSESSLSNSIYSQNIIYTQDNYENYDPKSPEDEELLEAIFSWQQN